MILTVTSAGLQAIAAAGAPGGPLVNITQYKLGDAYGYTPAVTDTALHGSLLYTGTPLNYSVLGNNSVDYTLYMDTSVGPFAFGEVGLYLSNGVLFALGSLTTPQAKTTGGTGNIINVDAILQVTNIAPVIQFNLPSSANARLLYVAHLVNLPTPPTANSNAYLTGDVDDGNNIIYALQYNATKWNFPTHQIATVANGIVATATTTNITSTNISALLPWTSSGKLIIQFTTGALAGYTRMLSATATNSATWADPFSIAATAGDRFDVYQSNFSVINLINQIPDDALVNAIVFGG